MGEGVDGCGQILAVVGEIAVAVGNPVTGVGRLDLEKWEKKKKHVN